MTQRERNQDVRLKTALDLLGLDSNWATSVLALCAQEIAIRKKLESLGVIPTEQDFQKIAEKLTETLKQEGQETPYILLSLARAYPYIRGRLVHGGNKTRLYDAEVESLVTNTIGLVEVFFQVMPKLEVEHEVQVYYLVEDLLNIDYDKLKLKINEFDSKQKKNIILALIEKYVEHTSSSFNLSEFGQYLDKERKIKILSKLILESMTVHDIITFLDTAFPRFATAIPTFIMEVLTEVCDKPPVVDFLRDKGYIDFIVSNFCSSNSFDQASINADVIAKISYVLTISQIEQIFLAIASNDQIRYSFGAQETLPSFIALYKKKVNPMLFEQVQQSFPP